MSTTGDPSGRKRMDTTHQPHKVFVYQKPELIANIKKGIFESPFEALKNAFNT